MPRFAISINHSYSSSQANFRAHRNVRGLQNVEALLATTHDAASYTIFSPRLLKWIGLLTGLAAISLIGALWRLSHFTH